MGKKALVAYATKHGFTGEVADYIGKTLKQAGLDVDVLAVREVESVDKYDAVVLGTAVKGDEVLPEAADFVEKHRNELAARPTALFGLSMLMQEPTPENKKKVTAILNSLRYEMRPIEVGTFGGVRDPKNIAWVLKWATKKNNVATGDFRDWEAIREWTNRVAGLIESGRKY